MHVNHDIALYVIRLLSLVLPLVKVEVRLTYVLAYSALGLVMVLHPLTLAVYSYIGWLLLLIGGWDKLSVEQSWRYLIASQMISSANYLVWYLVYQYEADTTLRIIELSQIVINLLAFVWLNNLKVQKFREYVPSDQKPIYLSGYDEEEEMVVRTWYIDNHINRIMCDYKGSFLNALSLKFFSVNNW